jgi:hypothetical protein
VLLGIDVDPPIEQTLFFRIWHWPLTNFASRPSGEITTNPLRRSRRGLPLVEVNVDQFSQQLARYFHGPHQGAAAARSALMLASAPGFFSVTDHQRAFVDVAGADCPDALACRVAPNVQLAHGRL